jgi:aspartyl-tRNA(Asn)/glutamyl-tRNA(Gln) amidotransferase subunit B
MAEFGLSAYDAGVLTSEPAIADYFESVTAEGAEAKAAANWVTGEAMVGYKQAGRFAVAPDALAELIGMVRDGSVSHQAGRKVYEALAGSGGAPLAVAERLGLLQVRDSAAIERWIEEVLAAYPDEVARYRGGEVKLLGFLIGLVMKQSHGAADPKSVQSVLAAKLRGE